jgi:hypothetical protein
MAKYGSNLVLTPADGLVSTVNPLVGRFHPLPNECHLGEILFDGSHPPSLALGQPVCSGLRRHGERLVAQRFLTTGIS